MLCADIIQKYILAGDKLGSALHEAMAEAFRNYCEALETALGNHAYISGGALSLSDVVLVCELALMSNEGRMTEQLAAAKLPAILPELKNYAALHAHVTELLSREKEKIKLAISKQAWLAAMESKIILLVLDGSSDLNNQDLEIISKLRKLNKEYIVCVGIDPVMSNIQKLGLNLSDWVKIIIDSTAEYTDTYKFQLAYFEENGIDGLSLSLIHISEPTRPS